ncbi:MAG TPA: MtrB/PioB family decaheme-associated outer membrane protein [Burkholderiaceae bacterium]|nr:MtrB/PioB family decaheme-associated outer membrane protein [Burkholderiaceae bacterium]HQR70506.1 MtrB/PioB family decaheme-associated outer membrane protein [Burkholderiaceae bacterium]
MTQHTRVREFSRSALALAVCAAFAGAQAQEKKEEAKSPVETVATAEAGAAGVTGDSKDRAFWGQYNGMRYQSAYSILNFDYSRLDTSNGTWLDVIGSNLGLQTRELGVLWWRQGNWKVTADYNELWSVNPYTVNSGVAGLGTTTPTATYLTGGPGSGYDYDPATKRKSLSLGGSKWFGGEFQLEGNVSSERKTGNTLFGVGNNCPGTVSSGCSSTPGATAGFGVLYFPQPIDYNHTQVEARLNYAGSSLQLSGGYYGSFFSNNNGALNPGFPGTLNNAVGSPLPAGTGVQGFLGQPVASAPENQFNYFDLTGAYTFSPAIKANFKLAYSQGKQSQEFSSAGLTGAPAGIGSLDGEVTSTLAQVRLVANPIANLSLNAEYRYQNNADDTPVVLYNQIGTTSYSNQRVSRENNSAKLEATYRFPWAIQGLAGVGWTSIDRGTFTQSASYTGVSAMREQTDETSWWIQVRRSMTETISGSLRYTGSSRNGSDWLAPAAGGVGLVTVSDPATQLGPNAIYIPTMADRDRSVVRLLLNWMATDALSVQFAIDYGSDSYNAPTQYALQDSKFDLYTLDVSYALSDAWSLNGYLSTGSQKLNQARPQGYILAFDDNAFNAGIGVNGRIGEKFRLGGTLAYVSNEDKYAQSVGPTTSAGNTALLAATGGLPAIVFRRMDLRLFGTYAFSERSTIRADAAYQRLTYDDWGWAYGGTPFLYSDNSTVYLQPNQNVGYVGVSYRYSWK